MGKFPAATYRNVARVAKKLGFSFCRQAKGSHEIWRRTSDGRRTTIPNHRGKALKRKTLKAVLDDMQVTADEFTKLKLGK